MKNNVKFLPCFSLIVTLLSSCTKNDPLLEGYETNPELRLVKATGSLSCAPPQFNSTANIYNAAFTRYSGWTCSDATYSVPLGDGYTLWLFGDSFVGTVHPLDESHPNRWRFPQGLISNTFMVQDSSGTFRTIVGPGPIDPETWLYKPIVKTGKKDLSPSDREFYWPGDAEVKNGKVYIFHS
jgi:hypothetical protein